MSLQVWNLLDEKELAMLFASGMLPSEIPAGFTNRRERVEAAQIVQLADERKRVERQEKEREAIEADLLRNFDRIARERREKKAQSRVRYAA